MRKDSYKSLNIIAPSKKWDKRYEGSETVNPLRAMDKIVDLLKVIQTYGYNKPENLIKSKVISNH